MKQKCCCNKKIAEEFLGLAKFLRLIGEDNRLKIICLLKNGERCVCEIWQNLDLPQNLISSHLKILKGANLIFSRREGKNIYYSIDQKTFKKYNLALTNFLKNYEK
ncbi:MAG: metalloregulator ArsR/SmtB family transcription factor [Patescibacteria group bacterium]